MIHKQPAQLSYFLYGGFVDLRSVISNAFSNCGTVITQSTDGVGEAWDKIWSDVFSLDALKGLFLFGFYLVQLIASAIVTPLICFSITVIQVAILLVLFLMVFTYFSFITLLDRIYCTIKAIVSHCPICQHKFSLPMYICPSCGREHDRLCPSFYGILSHKCECGKKLPATFFNGRQKLEARCPECKYGIKGGGLHASWSIPVIGGPNSGKTCYINMTMRWLEQNSNSKYGLLFEHVKTGRDEYEENANRLLRGDMPDKTDDRRLNYYQFYLTPKGAVKQQISLCDVAGELFDINDKNSGNNQISTQIGFRFSNAFILIIDPLSIPDYREEVSKTINLSNYKGSSQPIDEMLSTFLGTLKNIFRTSANDILNTDVAVVFTKADIPGLAQKIGESAILKNASSLEQKVKYKTQNELCERFLREYNEVNFINSLKSSFKSIQFFTCSALGHVMNGQPFKASNVEEPFFWLLNKQSTVIEKTTRQINLQGEKNK